MGNRAVITTKDKQLGIYLHWNGGRDSVEALLKYCELKGYRSPDSDEYGWARLCQVIGNFFGGGLSVGIGLYDNLDTDNWDNGVYIIDGWKIVGREFMRHSEQRNHPLIEMLKEIDSSQPVSEQLGEFLDAEEVPTETLQIGDTVYMQNLDGNYKPYTVVGFGENKRVNGNNVEGVPYVDKYLNDGTYSKNPNNYVRSKTCMIKRNV